MTFLAAMLIGLNCVNWQHGDGASSLQIDYGFPYTIVGAHYAANSVFIWTGAAFDVCFAIVVLLMAARIIEYWFWRPRPDPKGSA